MKIKKINGEDTAGKKAFWKRPIVIVAIAVLLVAVISTLVYQWRVVTLQSTVEQIGKEVAGPAGGVKFYSFTQGENIFQGICIDNGPCPRSTNAWAIAVSPEEQDNLLKQLLDKNGFNGTVDSSSKTVTGKKGDKTVNASFGTLYDYVPSTSAPAGKEWRAFTVTLN